MWRLNLLVGLGGRSTPNSSVAMIVEIIVMRSIEGIIVVQITIGIIGVEIIVETIVTGATVATWVATGAPWAYSLPKSRKQNPILPNISKNPLLVPRCLGNDSNESNLHMFPAILIMGKFLACIADMETATVDGIT